MSVEDSDNEDDDEDINNNSVGNRPVHNSCGSRAVDGEKVARKLDVRKPAYSEEGEEEEKFSSRLKAGEKDI